MNRGALLKVLILLLTAPMVWAQDRPDRGADAAELVLTLHQAVQMAFAGSPEVALAKVQSERASESLRETRALNLPQASTGTGLAYNNGFPLSIEGSAPSIIQVAVSQAIFSKRNQGLIREASESRRGAEIGAAGVRNELAARVALLFVDLHEARRLESLWAARLESAEAGAVLTQALLEAGRVRPVDLSLARAAAANARQQLLVTREGARVAAVRLADLTGIPASGKIQTADPVLDTDLLKASAEELYQRAVENHPEILQAESDVRAREHHLEAEKGEYYPQLNLIGEYAVLSRMNNYQDYFNRFSRNNYLLGVSIQIPLFNGHRTSARVARSRQEILEAQLRLQRAKSALRLSIEQGASQLRIAEGALELARMEEAAAQENLEVHTTLYESGRIAFGELENIRAQSQEKEIARVSADQVLWQRRIDLLLATGAIGAMF